MAEASLTRERNSQSFQPLKTLKKSLTQLSVSKKIIALKAD